MQHKESMGLDWPPVLGDSDNEDTYKRYADVYDALFDALCDDAVYYLGLADATIDRDAHVLELGTGTGRVAARMLAAGYAVTGIDTSEEMLAHARRKLAHDCRYTPVLADLRTMRLDTRFALAIAPYGMVAHLRTNEDRLAAFHTVYNHLEPGGIFAFDDMPSWISGPSDSARMEAGRTGYDAATGMDVRLICNYMDVADEPLSVRYDIIDWLAGDKVAKRLVIRVIFRNIALADELALLTEAGFCDVGLYGGFDGRAFDADNVQANTRLIITCRRPL